MDTNQPRAAFHLIGISHHTAGLEVREQFAFSPVQLASLLEKQGAAGRSALLLSTCNRCELYWWGDHDFEGWFRGFAAARGGIADDALLQLSGDQAIRHLLVVAAGLDSQILGETEILGQVRRAYDAARAAGTTTREMDAIFSAALSAGRRVRRETFLGRHPSSVSSAAVDLAAARSNGKLERVLVLGAGAAAEGVLRALHGQRATRTVLINRHPERATTLASAWGAEAKAWDEFDSLLTQADLLLVATAAAHPVVSAAALAQSIRDREGRTLMVMDLALPRNVEPQARALPGIELFDLDDLQRLCCPAAGTAAAALAEAERVLDEEMTRLRHSLRGLAVAPHLAELHRVGARIAQQEAEWALAHLEELTDRERGIVREMADRLVRRVLYPVSRSLRADGHTTVERPQSFKPTPQ
ncbi:MAG TPA: glutamyl-tRNA reductase [Gemmatimonadales bacterium]